MDQKPFDSTTKYESPKVTAQMSEEAVLEYVNDALREKGYNPVSQLVGYILSGDPSYITSHKEARSVIRRFERDELLETLVRYYFGDK